MQWIYLDNNATTQPAPEVLAAMQEINEHLWANPSSIHRFGQSVRQRLELARASVGRLINAKPRQLVFTSGGTESNNLALRGTLGQNADDAPDVLITSPIEHAAIREPAEDLEKLGVVVDRVTVGPTGRVAPEAIAEALARYTDKSRAIIVSIQWANNETGVIQPIAEIARIVDDARQAAIKDGRSAKIYLHVDGTQAVGKIPVDMAQIGVDILTLAGHKFHGPKGTGVLYLRLGRRIRGVNRGGPQERQIRGGTENTPAIVGLGVAADLARSFLEDENRIKALTAMRDRFEKAICQAIPNTVVNSASVPRLWNTTNLAFPGLEAEAILLGLSERGICASAGAACSSGSLEPSPVLLAMGIPEPVAHGSVRFSLSRYTTEQEIDQAIDVVPQVVQRLGKTMPVAI